MDIDAFVNDCFQSVEEFKNAIKLANEIAANYNNKVSDFIKKCESKGDDETTTIIKETLPLTLPIVDPESVVQPNPDAQDDKSYELDDEWDELDEYEDAYVQGSGTRYLKGTGKNNHKEPYTQKGVRNKLKNI